MATKDDLFLITGATGNTGAPTVNLLRQAGHRVRAFVHKVDSRSQSLEDLGAEVVAGDLLDFEAVSSAMAGVRAAYFCYPIAPGGVLQATAIFAAAGAQTGLQSMVNMSQITARPDHESPAARQHWLAERVLDWSGIGVTHLRPPFFLENLFNVAAPTVSTEGKIYLPYGQGRHAPIAGQDIARVAVGILTDPAAHRGKTYVPTGPESLSMTEQASVFTAVLGRPVQYVDIAVEDWRQILSQVPVMTPWLIEHLVRVAQSHQHGEFDAVTDVVETIGGTPPQSLEAFIHDNHTAFAMPQEAHPHA
jgi:NAD(P)H dehydrogenase (quinone)